MFNFLKKITIAILLMCSLLVSCKQEAENPVVPEPSVTNTVQNVPVFQGKIIYEASARAEHPNDLKLFYDFSPTKIEVWFSGTKFRMVETGGLSKGNILLDTEVKKAWQLDGIKKIAFEAVYSDLDNASEILKREMPDHFSPTVEHTHDTDTILGYVCKKLAVLRSGFVRSESETYLWVTNEIVLPPSRFDIQTEVNKVTVPIPISIGYKEGTVLKMQIDDEGLVVTYEVTEIDFSPIAPSFFKIPNDFIIK